MPFLLTSTKNMTFLHHAGQIRCSVEGAFVDGPICSRRRKKTSKLLFLKQGSFISVNRRQIHHDRLDQIVQIHNASLSDSKCFADTLNYSVFTALTTLTTFAH